MRAVFFILLGLYHLNIMSQTNEYFKDISKYPTEINNGNIISRMINGLGYRYYWATEKLNENDLIYRPSKDAYSTKETMVHIFTLSKTVYNTTLSKINERPDIDIPVDYKSIRNETLQFLEKASKNFLNLNSKELDQMKIKFNRGGTIKSFPIWNLLNGPIADAIYHTGQIVSFRRTTGNPIDSSVNVFMGSYRQK
ncbi:MAG: hypothetical protein EVA36_04800 [Flavobacteriales bacterium]|nr:MAG: hypothetical protein EVA36_04800 [Flavobacteriales bacterium]